MAKTVKTKCKERRLGVNQASHACQKKENIDQIFEGFLDFPKKYEILNFWISGFLYFWNFGFLDFFWISGYILATKRATGDPLVSKRPDF